MLMHLSWQPGAIQAMVFVAGFSGKTTIGHQCSRGVTDMEPGCCTAWCFADFFFAWQAKQLLASEDEEEAEEDDEADTAAYKAANGGAAPSSNDSDDQCRDVEGNEQQQQQLAASGEQEQMQQQQRTRWGEEQPADGNGVLDMDSSPDEQQAHTPR